MQAGKGTRGSDLRSEGLLRGDAPIPEKVRA